jgi:hypothetical protein
MEFGNCQRALNSGKKPDRPANKVCKKLTVYMTILSASLDKLSGLEVNSGYNLL